MDNAYDDSAGKWVLSKLTLAGESPMLPSWDINLNKHGKMSDIESTLESHKYDTLGY